MAAELQGCGATFVAKTARSLRGAACGRGCWPLPPADVGEDGCRGHCSGAVRGVHGSGPAVSSPESQSPDDRRAKRGVWNNSALDDATGAAARPLPLRRNGRGVAAGGPRGRLQGARLPSGREGYSHVRGCGTAAGPLDKALE